MKRKSRIVSIATFVLVTGLLILAGDSFMIPWLMLHHKYIVEVNGVRTTTTTGSIVSLMIGLAASYVTGKIYLYMRRQ